MKILITGGAGFIGSHIADRYLAAGHDVVVVDDLSTGKRANIPAAATFYEVDIRDPASEQLIADERPDVISHHAAQMDVRVAVSNPRHDASINVMGALNVLEAARQVRARVIFASTGGAVYGEPTTLPVCETAPLEPMSPYGLSKQVFEHYLSLYQRLHGLKYTVLRYGNVYGPRQDPKGEAGVVAIFAGQVLRGEESKIFGDGSKTRDYLHVSDVATANMLAIEDSQNAIYNVGCGQGITDLEVFRTICRAAGVKREPTFAPPRLGELAHIHLSCEKISRTLGWAPTFDFESGIADSVGWYRDRESEARQSG
ncbi:MAG: NAD-dependent epimerase/dehydratase family protein [Pseudomonadota bacterium]